MKTISVCIATYNGERYIQEQLFSILKQLSLVDEIIISDDHSIDNTINLIKSINDSRIRIFQNDSERGYTGNFENAIRKSSGDIIFYRIRMMFGWMERLRKCLCLLKNQIWSLVMQ